MSPQSTHEQLSQRTGVIDLHEGMGAIILFEIVRKGCLERSQITIPEDVSWEKNEREAKKQEILDALIDVGLIYVTGNTFFSPTDDGTELFNRVQKITTQEIEVSDEGSQTISFPEIHLLKLIHEFIKKVLS